MPATTNATTFAAGQDVSAYLRPEIDLASGALTDDAGNATGRAYVTARPLRAGWTIYVTDEGRKVQEIRTGRSARRLMDTLDELGAVRHVIDDARHYYAVHMAEILSAE